MSKILTRDAILKAKLTTETVYVPQWDGEVVIHEMPVARRNELFSLFVDEKGNQKPVSLDMEMQMFIAGMHEPEFEMDDAKELQKVSGAAITYVVQHIMRLNGFSDESLDDARGES